MYIECYTYRKTVIRLLISMNDKYNLPMHGILGFDL